MKLQQILFKEVVFDPKTSRGADNSRSFYHVNDKYDIDLDPASGIVKVSCDNGRHNCVHISNAKEWRELSDLPMVLTPAAPKFEMVKTAEGAFVMQPVKKSEPEVVETADDVAIPPRKRGRPKKIPVALP